MTTDTATGDKNKVTSDEASARQSLSLIFSQHPEIERTYQRWQLDNARPLYPNPDDRGNMRWTFNNPHPVGS